MPPRIFTFPYMSRSLQTGSDIEAYQSFCFIPGFRDMSFEELRYKECYEYSFPARSMTKFGCAVDKSIERSQAAYPIKDACPNLHKDVKNVLRFLVVTISVTTNDSKEKADFSIHQNILEHRSPFFASALKKEWNPKGAEKAIPLEETYPDTFKLYAEWIYSGHIWRHTYANDDGFKTLIQAYILGDKVLDTLFKNVVIDAIITKFLNERRFDLALQKLVYENTTPNSPLRNLLVDIYLHYGWYDWLSNEEAKANAHVEFLVDLSVAQYKCYGYEAPPKPATFVVLRPCAYHEHGSRWDCVGGVTTTHPREIEFGVGSAFAVRGPHRDDEAEV